MTKFVVSDTHTEHGGIIRVQGALEHLRHRAARCSASARRALAALRAASHAWTQARRREAEAEKLWNAALRDARITADLSRAMHGIAVDDMRRYS